MKKLKVTVLLLAVIGLCFIGIYFSVQYLFFYSPKINAGEIWIRELHINNPFKEIEIKVYKIIGVKDGYVKYKQLSRWGEILPYYSEGIYAFLSWGRIYRLDMDLDTFWKSRVNN